MKRLFKKIVIFLLTLEARLILRRHKPVIICVTGSVGKTTTKDLIYTTLQSLKSVRRNIKSYNSEIGVPLTVLDLPNAWSGMLGWSSNLVLGLWRTAVTYTGRTIYPKWLILEVGADHPGDIENVVKWLKPTYGVLTGFGSDVPVHVEFFKSIDELVEEKSNLLRILPREGMAFINRDDARAWGTRGCTRARLSSYGFGPDCKVIGSNLGIIYDEQLGSPIGMSYRLEYDGKSVPIRLMGVLGEGVAYASLAAASVALELGVNAVNISEAISGHQFAPGRMRLLSGVSGSILIDDTYNSSPSAVRMALDILHEVKLSEKGSKVDGASSRKIVVLGAMLELGEHSMSEHEKVGEWLRGIADVVVCVGELGRVIGQSALSDGCLDRQVHFFDTAIEAGDFLKMFVNSGDVVLLKASQSVRLERATEILLTDPADAIDLLPRQEKEWKAKA